MSMNHSTGPLAGGATPTGQIAARLWHALYPDRRPWGQLGDDVKDEWRRFVTTYESLRDEPTEAAELDGTALTLRIGRKLASAMLQGLKLHVSIIPGEPPSICVDPEPA